MTDLEDYSRENVDKETIETVKSVGSQYKYGFVSDIETDFAPKGISEDIVRLISKKNTHFKLVEVLIQILKISLLS